MAELNNLPCCGPTETVRLKELPHAYGLDFDLHQCLACGRTWVYMFSPAGDTGVWEWVGESDAQQMLESSGKDLQRNVRDWAEKFR